MKKVADLTPEEFSLPPLHQAARQRDLEAAQAFLAAGHAVDEPDAKHENGDGGNTPLWYAAQGLAPGGETVAQLLIFNGANPNAAGEYGTTPLHIACSWGHVKMVSLLCTAGADPELRDHQGRTAVELAARDWQAGLNTPDQERLPGWDTWLQGMAEINSFFATIHKRAE